VPQKKNEAKKSCVVSVQGCVNKPGTFLLSGDNVRLYDVIDMAGGFTEDAYLPLAYILRISKEFKDKQLTQWSIAENFQYSDLQLEDTTRYYLDVSYKKPVVSCDFEAAFIDSVPKANIVLHDGDVIVVPSNPKTVFVYGQVGNPGYITFKPGKTLDWYVEQAGGYAINAEKSRARIIDGRTKVWRKGGDDVIVKAGDEIYVPKPPDMPPGIRVQTWAIIISAVTSAATLLSIIFTIVNSMSNN
jgi:protein involved in polysaccharide export with SLBB domain